MRNKKQLLIEQLDNKLVKFEDSKTVQVPAKGWINTIRTTLNMTRAQLGVKLKMTKGAIQKIEERDALGQITINKLNDVANALDMKLVYALVPKNSSIDDLIQLKAEELAKKIVLRTNQNMKLEGQGIGDQKITKTVKELAYEIKREMKKSLWD